MILVPVSTVFVPFEHLGGDRWKKRDDLPRFLQPKEVIDFLTSHPEVSMRNGRYVRIDWREHSERDLIKEYTDGVGTKR